MVINTVLGLILTVLFYLVVPVVILFTIRDKKVLFIIATVLISLFMIALFVMTLFDVSISKDVVTIYADFSGQWCSKNVHFSLLYGGIRDVVINLAMVIPMGGYIVIYNACFDKKHILLKCLIIGLIIGFSIEALQFILPVSRSIQLRDMLLNALSTVIGGIIYIVIYKIRNKIIK